MISIQPYEVGSVEGFEVPLLPATQISGNGRRVTRTPTLDGGVSVYNAGYSVGDLNLTVEIPVDTYEDVIRARILEELHPDVVVTHPEGVFRGIIEGLDTSNGASMEMSILITERLNEPSIV